MRSQHALALFACPRGFLPPRKGLRRLFKPLLDRANVRPDPIGRLGVVESLWAFESVLDARNGIALRRMEILQQLRTLCDVTLILVGHFRDRQRFNELLIGLEVAAFL